MKNIVHLIEQDLAGELDRRLGGDLPKILAIVGISKLERLLAKHAKLHELYPE